MSDYGSKRALMLERDEPMEKIVPVKTTQAVITFITPGSEGPFQGGY
jgi:hypothetical protein